MLISDASTARRTSPLPEPLESTFFRLTDRAHRLTGCRCSSAKVWIGSMSAPRVEPSKLDERSEACLSTGIPAVLVDNCRQANLECGEASDRVAEGSGLPRWVARIVPLDTGLVVNVPPVW
jgi:hypothetical protein